MNKRLRSIIPWLVLIGGVIVGFIAVQFVIPAVQSMLAGPAPDLSPPALPSIPTTADPDVIELFGRSELFGITLTPIVAVLGLLLVTLVGIGLLVGPIFLLFTMLGRLSTGVQDDEAYQQAVQTLEARDKQYIKERRELQPPNPMPEHERPTWSAVSTGLIIALLVTVVGIGLGASYAPDSPIMSFVGWSFLAGLALAAIMVNRERIADVGSGDYGGIPWGTIWVVVSGALVVGLGLGFALWVRANTGA